MIYYNIQFIPNSRTVIQITKNMKGQKRENTTQITNKIINFKQKESEYNFNRFFYCKQEIRQILHIIQSQLD